MRKLKVLHILNTGKFSGAENVACQIISLFKGNAVAATYVSYDGTIREALQERGIDFNPVRKMSVSELKRVIREENPDVIHAHDMKASFTAALACGKIPLVSHIHNNAFDSRSISVKSIAYYFAAWKAKHIFWVSQPAYEGYVFHKAFQKKSSVLVNIIDAEALKNKMVMDTEQYSYDMVFLGRLSGPKNPQRLIGVFAGILEQRPTTKLAIVGSGELESEVKQLVEEKGISDHVAFLGFQSNPYKILHDAKLMIMTSRYEGMPMCALEAMALGVPIVSTPTDGLKDVVETGVTGFLHESDEELCNSCLRILENADLQSKLSANSVKRAAQLMDLGKYRENILDVYMGKNA